MRAPLTFLLALAATSAHAAPSDWLDETVLAECEYCKTAAFDAERRALANQAGARHHPASGVGYVVTFNEDGRFVWGRAALVGTGNLIRTDAHVLFADTGQLKNADEKLYFEPLHHPGTSNLIEIDLSAVQRGSTVGPLETDIKNDWAIARLKEDAIEKFGRDRVFAFLWDLRVTHDQILEHEYSWPPTLVSSREQALDLYGACEGVADDHPADYAFGVDEVFFTRCPSQHLQVGSSGSTLAILSDGVWNLGGQIVAGGSRALVRQGASEDTNANEPVAQQVFLGSVPAFRETIAIVYLQELIRRGMDPRDR